MNCLTCERTNPADARFCIYCSAQLTSPAPLAQAAQPAAIGPTTRLPETAIPSYTMPASAPMPATAAPHASAHLRRTFPQFNQSTGALFLIGLGVLFLTGNFWPGILVLIGMTSFISETGHGRQNKGLGTLIFFTGLAFLFWSGAFFPGILILLGIMALLNSRHGFCR